ncbi:MAG: glycosyltransferase family 2 protein [Thermoanaerobaculia bacterium]
MKLAVVLVHYHTPDLLRPACDALVADAAAGGIELEGLVVDNGSGPEDRGVLQALPFPCLTPGCNLGFAGGVNLGFRKTTADVVVMMNPDVEVLPGCLAALTEALEDGAAAAGPRFYWDQGKRFLLPPTEEVSRRAELLRLLAQRSPAWAARARGRWRHHARRHWTARAPVTTYDLSGALLAIRRPAWRRVGSFDKEYRLYFEETDWLLRLRSSGLAARFVPAAEAVHLFAQSTAVERRAEAWFLKSHRRFRRRAYGGAFTRLLELFGPSRKTSGLAGEPLAVEDASRGEDRRRRAAWLEVSSSPIGYPAAGRRLRGDRSEEDLPPEIYARLAPGTYTLRTVDTQGRELAAKKLAKS